MPTNFSWENVVWTVNSHGRLFSSAHAQTIILHIPRELVSGIVTAWCVRERRKVDFERYENFARALIFGFLM